MRHRSIQPRVRNLLVFTTAAVIMIPAGSVLLDWSGDDVDPPATQVVTVPDGGTVTLGSIDRMRDDTLMVMVTPRIIIEEESEMLGLPDAQ